MNPKSSVRDVIYVCLISFFIAIILTALIFIKSESDLPLKFLFIGMPCLTIILLIIKRYLGRRIKIRVEKQWQIFVFLDLVAHELLPNRISLVIIGFLFILFLGLEQAQELLLHLADSSWPPPLFYGVLLILALVSWYWTRFMYPDNVQKFKFKILFSGEFKEHLNHENPDVVHIRGILPKILGLIIIIIPSIFMLKLYLSNVTENRANIVIIGTCAMIWILALIFYALSKVAFYQFLKDWLETHRWFVVLILCVFAFLSLILFFQGDMNTPEKIPLLYFSGLVVAILYFLITSIKIERMFFVRNKDPKNRISRAIFAASIGISTGFIIFNISPLYFNINGLTILMSGLILYSFLAYFLVILGGKVRVPILTLLIIICVTLALKVSPNGNLHNIRLTADSSRFDPRSRATIDEYIEGWFDNNHDLIEAYTSKGKKFPIIFVSAEGGGSRAALWTLLVHDTLENQIDDYYQHIFSMSGASGGNTGNSFYLAFQEIRDTTKPVQIKTLAKTVFSTDFVSTDIGMLFGRDAWQTLSGLSFCPDRSEILQQKWEITFDHAQSEGYSSETNPLRREFLSFWYQTGEGLLPSRLFYKHPLFLLNTTHVQSGDHATMSAVKLEDFIPENMDLLNHVYNEHNKKSVPLSSGTLMNARFPIVNPSGRIENVGNFVDAGYYDNFGGFETRSAIRAIIKYLERSKFYKRSDFKLVHFVFRNGLPDKKMDEYVSVRANRKGGRDAGYKDEAYRVYEAPAEVIVPILGLTNAAFAHPNRELAEIESIVDTAIYFDLKRTPVELVPGDPSTLVNPIIPLSRHLSGLAIESMQARINKIMDRDMNKRLNAIFSTDSTAR